MTDECSREKDEVFELFARIVCRSENLIQSLRGIQLCRVLSGSKAEFRKKFETWCCPCACTVI